MSERGWVTELPDGRLQYQERINDKPWYDPYPETPFPEKNVRRSTQRAYDREHRAVKAIDEYLKAKQEKKTSAPKVTPSHTTPKITSSTTPNPKRNLISKLLGKK